MDKAKANAKARAIRIISEKCEAYIEHIWPKLEKRGGVSDLPPMNRKAKGESSPAIPEHGLQVVEANAHASKYLRFFLEVFENGERKSRQGVYYSLILRALRYDPGILTNLRGNAGEDADVKRMLDAFHEICEQVAKGVVWAHGVEAADDEDFRVVVHPQDEQQRQATREGQKRDTAHTDRVIVRRVESLEREGLGREEAKRALTQDPENTWSYPRIKRAINAENRRRDMGGAA